MSHEIHPHPAEPLLANALRQSLQTMREEADYMHRLMEAALRMCPNAIGGERILDPSGQEFGFIPPSQVKLISEAVSAGGAEIAEEIERAQTAEEQERLLLGHMREMLDSGLLYNANTRVALSMIATIDVCFQEYAKHGEHRSRALIDMSNNIRYYAGICYDTLACSEALMANIPDNHLHDGHHFATSPYDVAHMRAIRLAPPVVGEDAATTDHHEEAKEIFCEALEPYDAALPNPLSTDMLGLILRCSEKVADRVHKENGTRLGKFRTLHAGNDNGPTTQQEILADPLIRRRVNSILGTLFAQHPDAGRTPGDLLEASLTLEELLAHDERLHESKGRGR